MGFADSDKINKIKDRVDSINKIAEQLNAKYFNAFYSIKHKFEISIDNDLKDGNLIIGNFNDYDYFFIEGYHQKSGKNDYSHWISKLIIKLKDKKIPNFQLITKKSVLIQILKDFLLGIFLFLLPFTYFFTESKAGIILFFILLLFFGGLSLLAFSESIEGVKKIFLQDKYRIFNNKFKERYIILSNNDPSEISKLLSDEVCSTIVNYPSDINLLFKDNYAYYNFDYNKQLTFTDCKEILNTIHDIVKNIEKTLN